MKKDKHIFLIRKTWKYICIFTFACGLLNHAYAVSQLSSEEQQTGQEAQAFVIQIKGINHQEYIELREYLVLFEGYDEIKLLLKSPSLIELQYISRAAPARLEHNLTKVLESMGLTTYLTFTAARFDIVVIDRSVTHKLTFGEW